METGGFWLPGERPTQVVVTNQACVVVPIVLTLQPARAVTLAINR